MPFETEILIIGGGLAGLTAALHLQKIGIQVVLIEKKKYPHHKVCGEYISNEVIPYLDWLQVNVTDLAPTTLSYLKFTATNGGSIHTKLPLGGFGISRYTLDNHLYQLAMLRGVQFFHERVVDVHFTENSFTVETNESTIFKAKQVIGAYGKRENLDAKLSRDFMRKKSFYLGVKAHFKSDFPSNLVSLNNFKGGYCGVSKVENDTLNLCYLANYETFKQYKNIETYQENVLYKNPFLKNVFENATMIFDAPLTISQITFDRKEPVHHHILMIGDTAGLIHPLCGNGMAMAIHSAKLVCNLLSSYMQGLIDSRASLEQAYTRVWQQEFGYRLKTGRMLASLLRNQTVERFAMSTLTKIPFVLNSIIKQTHGNLITKPN